MMRLPDAPEAEGLDACFVGVTFDLGTSNRTGARFGPRQIRAESALLRAINPYNLPDSDLVQIEKENRLECCPRFHHPTMSKLKNLDELFSGRRFNRDVIIL